MFDEFLTSLLKVVIVVDILGAVGYFVLGALKKRRREGLPASPEIASPVKVVPLRRPWRQRLADRLRAPWSLRPVAGAAPATEVDFARLRRILDSFQEGLACPPT